DRAGVCAAVARTGNLALLKRAREEGCPWNHRTSAAAAEGGHLHVLKWVRGEREQQQQQRRDQKGKKDGDPCSSHRPLCPWHANTAMAAASGGHLEVLKWLRENGCGWDEYTCHKAASGGHLEIIQCGKTRNGPTAHLSYPAVTNELHEVRHSTASRCCFTCFTGSTILSKVVQWARANGCEWNAATCSRAARGGHLLLLKWARGSGCPWDASTCMGAAEGDFSSAAPQ
ncbi:unnamed protein product, partial [Hapterophycus canaliculatus]